MEVCMASAGVMRKSVNTEDFELQLGDDGPLSASELGEYLFLLNQTYAAGISMFGESLDFPERMEEWANRFRQNLTGPLRLGNAAITIARIEKNSPPIIWGMCNVSLLCLAVILSGGEVDLKNHRFTMNALGEGIAKLRAAFSGAPAQGVKSSARRGAV
jgi:hypothetical protein